MVLKKYFAAGLYVREAVTDLICQQHYEKNKTMSLCVPSDHAEADSITLPFKVTQDLRLCEDSAWVDQQELLCWGPRMVWEILLQLYTHRTHTNTGQPTIR